MTDTMNSREGMAMSVSEITRRPSRSDDVREFRALYLICLALFLPAAIVARFLPARWRPWPPTDRNSRSVIEEARAAVSAYVPFAMMG